MEEYKMFKQNKWITISVLAAAMIVALGVVGGTVYARSGDSGSITQVEPLAAATTNIPDNTTRVYPQKELADRVAAILGVDTSKVEAAFTQAEKEIRAERAAAMLKAEEARIDQMVTDGKLTADQAAKYKAWLESKPSVDLPRFNMSGNDSHRGGPNGFSPRGQPGSQGAPNSTGNYGSSGTTN
jgi:hypothetical protein